MLLREGYCRIRVCYCDSVIVIAGSEIVIVIVSVIGIVGSEFVSLIVYVGSEFVSVIIVLSLL